jgi:hypothetical protein
MSCKSSAFTIFECDICQVCSYDSELDIVGSVIGPIYFHLPEGWQARGDFMICPRHKLEDYFERKTSMKELH